MKTLCFDGCFSELTLRSFGLRSLLEVVHMCLPFLVEIEYHLFLLCLFTLD